MKKLIIAAAIVCAAAMSQAASVKWKANGSSAVNNYSVYLVMATGEWSSAADVASDSIGGGTIVDQGRGSYNVSGTAASADLTKSTSSLIAVVVTSDGKKYATTSVNVAGLVYDPNAQPPESSPGTATFSVTGLTYKDFSTVPEPTSGLLLLLGVAGLALRRKQK